MSGYANRRAGRSAVYQGIVDPSSRASSDSVYGVVLLDRLGGLLGVSTTTSLPGEVAMPMGVNLRTHDLATYLSEDRGFHRPRRFPLSSATWVHVGDRRVRVGIYMESGASATDNGLPEPDLGLVAAILSSRLR